MDAAHFAADLLEKIGVTVGGSGPADIHIHDDRFYKRVIRDRELGLGEATRRVGGRRTISMSSSPSLRRPTSPTM